LTRDALRSFIRDEALKGKWAAPGVLELYALSDSLRSWRRFVGAARRGATDTPAGWDRLELAARVEREAFVLELHLDECPGACV
jgi:hypothetical protein